MQRVRPFCAAAADIQRDGAGAVEQPVEMVVEEHEPPLVQRHPFPHAVAEDEAGVERQYAGLVARHHVAMEADVVT